MNLEEKAEVLIATKRLLGIRDNTNDARIVLCIDDTADSVMSCCQLDIMPRQLISLLPILVAQNYNK